MATKHIRPIVGGAVILTVIAYLMITGTRETFTYYYTVGELLSNDPPVAGEAIRVNGVVAAGSISRDNADHILRFLIVDRAKGAFLPVKYEGIVPGIFKEGIDVVVEGRYVPGGTFVAGTLLAKCPSKYEALMDDGPTASSGR